MTEADLGVEIAGVKLKNPVIAASGTFGYGEEYAGLFDINSLGGLVVKGISLKPRQGNPPPRIVETPCGMLNSIGLANIGLDAFVKEKLPYLSGLSTAVIVNIYGHSIKEYAELAGALKGLSGISLIEVNISCPNVECGGMAFGTDPDMSARVTDAVVSRADLPVIVKLSPNVTDIRAVARAVEKAGASAVSLINTLTGMAVDLGRRSPVLGNVIGGLSGPAIKPVALYMVYQTAKSIGIPVIGMGGIVNYRDALEFIIAGASAVQIGTANFINPRAAVEVIEGIRQYCETNAIARISDLTGSIRA
ncbi:MAG: dihydroorotate dehydrogenase [Deltaproteobacteria bacterium CG_4_10_14_3_um_filter_51_14]|nr:dihydroorotate dehydrogenase [bacterium]OIP40369.1 MAG: dihydroorotate dehydrogenase B catalytic subunit [Desulfobacteraceae bacterium CG2_30_51_40]PIY22908.1 MAG: dihydroorotate dehydrogenase [Deltaproteobacteria bacterium CG_4_10_14_3_um_filter_51_14]